MTGLSIRILLPSEVPLLRGLLQVFSEAFEDPESYASRPPSDRYLGQMLASGSFLAMAAWRDGQMAGGLAGYVLPKFEQERHEFYLYDLAVLEPFRRQGIATALIQALRQAAAERGLSGIFVQADQADEPALRLYERLGIPAAVVHFDIPLR